MAFIDDTHVIAREQMLSIRPELADLHSKLIQFLIAEPMAASATRRKNSPAIGSVDY
jgi:hypothetical protein